MEKLVIKTSKKDQVIDITENVESKLEESSKAATGWCFLFAAHTTCALTTLDLDPGTDLDFLEALRKLLPDIQYRHPHDPSHTPDHLLASILGPSLVVPYKDRKMLLGTWQRIVLLEFAGPREREIYISFITAS